MRRLALVVVAALTAALSCGSPAGCAPVQGGDPGVLMQLRRISFGDDQLSLLFALRPDAPYGIPAHGVTADGGTILVRVPGARLRHADGTPSYFGPLEPDPPPGRLRSLKLSEAADGSLLVEIDPEGSACPRVTSRIYGLGTTFSAALVSIALRDGPVVALDPDRRAPGQAAQVIGMGFEPSTVATFQVDGRKVWDSRTDERGQLDTVLFMPEREGRSTVLVRDGSRSALAWFVVDAGERR